MATHTNESTGRMEERLARALGWFSIGLGLAEAGAPGNLSGLLGVEERPTLLRSLGLREIASGLGILAQRRPAGWLWARVAGDLIDLGLLGAAYRRTTAPARLTAATAAVAGVTLLDAVVGDRLTRRPGETPDQPQELRLAITVNRTPEETYRFWRDLPNMARCMIGIESVQPTDDRRSHWVAAGPRGVRLEWDAETTDDTPNQRIAWRTVAGAPIELSGDVRFQAAPRRGTEVRVAIRFRPPGGRLAATAARLLGKAPRKLVYEGLRRMKHLLETGEIPTTTGQPSGRRSTIVKAANDLAA